MPVSTRNKSKTGKGTGGDVAYSEEQRSVGQQTVSNDRTYISPQSCAQKNLEFQEYSPAFYKPHTLKSLALLILILFGFSQSDFLERLAEKTSLTDSDTASQSVQNFKVNGANMGVCFAAICVGAIHLPNTIMTRPHPIFWRALMAIMILYALFMTYLLLLPVDIARQTLRIFDDNLGQSLPERSYGDDCRVFTPEHPTSFMANISDAVFDVHFVAHFLGWWGKMCFMRDWYLAWVCSIGFEICELTFRHWLPNFYECWWDHLFLDLFGCNLIGIILGHYTLKYYGSKKATWIFDGQQQAKQTQKTASVSCQNQMITFVQKLRPAVFEKYEWAGLANIQKLMGVTAAVIMLLVIDCNNFFLKTALWIPPEHDLLKYRVAMWGLGAFAIFKEWYEYTSNEYCHRLGPFAWLAFYTVSVEVMTVAKCTAGQFTAPFPLYVKIMWLCIAVGYCMLLSIAYTNQQLEDEAKKDAKEFNPYNPDLDIIDHSKKTK